MKGRLQEGGIKERGNRASIEEYSRRFRTSV